MTGTRSQPSSLTLRAPSALASSGSSPTPGTRATTHRSTSASRSTWQVRSEGSLLPSNARSAGARPWSPRSVTSKTSTGWDATTWPGELAMQPTPCSRPWATTSASSSGGSLSAAHRPGCPRSAEPLEPDHLSVVITATSRATICPLDYSALDVSGGGLRVHGAPSSRKPSRAGDPGGGQFGPLCLPAPAPPRLVSLKS